MIFLTGQGEFCRPVTNQSACAILKSHIIIQFIPPSFILHISYFKFKLPSQKANLVPCERESYHRVTSTRHQFRKSMWAHVTSKTFQG